MKKLISCVLAVTMIFGMSISAFAKRNKDDDFRASESKLILSDFDDEKETISPGDTITFSFEDKREYPVYAGTQDNVDGRYNVTYSNFDVDGINYDADRGNPSGYVKLTPNSSEDEVTITAESMDDDDFDKKFDRGICVKFDVSCDKEWTKIDNGETGSHRMSGSFEVWVSTGNVSGNNEYGIEIDDLDEGDICSPGVLYEYDLMKESGSSLDPDDEEKFTFSVKPTKGSAFFDVFELRTNKEGHYKLCFRGNVDMFDNELKDIEITTKIREKGERDEIENVVKFQLGYEEEWEDNSQIDIDNDHPYIRLDSELDYVEASVDNICKIKWRRLDNRGYNFTYDDRANDNIVKNSNGATLKFLNFKGNPTFAADATVKLNIYKTPYVYEYDQSGSLTPIKTELKDAGTYHFQTNKLGNYVFSSKVLSASKVEQPVVKPQPQVQNPPTPTSTPSPQVATPSPQAAAQQPQSNIVAKGMFNDEAATNYVNGKYNPPTGAYFC